MSNEMMQDAAAQQEAPMPSPATAFFNSDNTPGYSEDGLRNLNRAREILMEEHGLDMDVPSSVRDEIDQRMRGRLTNTTGRNLSVRMLLALWAEA